jgi:TM2 domain-containing membrane protein YozV
MTDNPLPAATHNLSTHSKTIGYLLWIFGFLGAHRFYYGKRKTGLLWMCTLGLLGVGWLVDLFLIHRMDQEADKRYTFGRLDYSLAWLLLTFFGYFGVHRAYQGKWFTAALMCTTTVLLVPLWVGIPIIALAIGHDFWTLNQQIDEHNRITNAAFIPNLPTH